MLLETWPQVGPIDQTRSVNHAVDYARWHHVAVTMDRDSDEAIMYVDGERVQLAASNFANDFLDNQALSVGRYRGTPEGLLPFHFQGMIDDLRIYDVALSNTEIEAIRKE